MNVWLLYCVAVASKKTAKNDSHHLMNWLKAAFTGLFKKIYAIKNPKPSEWFKKEQLWKVYIKWITLKKKIEACFLSGLFFFLLSHTLHTKPKKQSSEWNLCGLWRYFPSPLLASFHSFFFPLIVVIFPTPSPSPCLPLSHFICSALASRHCGCRCSNGS